MAPSKESQAQRALFLRIGEGFEQSKTDFLQRCVYDQVHRLATEAPGVTYEDANAAGVAGIWMKPATASPRHALLYMHGGGFVFGSPNGHRKLTAHLAKACNMTALSVDYRLSPETSFPVAINDCVKAYQYLLDSGYAAKNIVVGGDSCGGHLSTSVPLALLAKGLPMPAASISLSPWYDLTPHMEGSMTANKANDALSTVEYLELLSASWIKGTGAKNTDALVSPMHAPLDDLKRLPPHWISCGGYDILLDHGVRFAEKLKRAGVEVVLEVHDGQQHVVEMMAGKAPEADQSLARIGAWAQKKAGA